MTTSSMHGHDAAKAILLIDDMGSSPSLASLSFAMGGDFQKESPKLVLSRFQVDEFKRYYGWSDETIDAHFIVVGDRLTVSQLQCMVELVAPEEKAGMSYGPARKGKGGKLRRW